MDDPEADRARVGDYVRRALPRELARRGIDWPCSVDWDEVTIRAHISRGELVIPTWESGRWWYPVSKAHGDRLVEELAEVLFRWWSKHYQHADESGRLSFVMWETPDGALHRDRQEEGRAVTVTLAPGVRFGESGGASFPLLYHLGGGPGAGYLDAITMGWMEVE